MVSFKTPYYFAEAVVLDVISFPGKFMSRRGNARWHLDHVCSRCSKWRKKFRDPDFCGEKCLWEERWQREDYNFPRDFGIFNWAKYYFGMRTNLNGYVENESNSNI